MLPYTRKLPKIFQVLRKKFGFFLLLVEKSVFFVRMSLLKGLEEVIGVHMSVNLSGSDIAVTQKLLDRPQVRPVLKKMRGKAVA